LKLNRGWVIAFGIYFLILLVIIVLAYQGILPVKLSAIPFYDTLGHFILLGSASYLGHKAIGRQVLKIWHRPFTLPLAPLLLSVFAAVDESLQALSPLRTCSLSDMSANLIGIWFFYYVAVRK
jgi:VanZ family protein